MARILVIDDDPSIRELLCLMLCDLGHEVLEAEDGEQGFSVCLVAPVDLVITDLVMPGLTGAELLARMKQDSRLKNLPVLVVSGVGDMSVIAQCIKMGADDYLLKPFNSVLLAARVSSSLERKVVRDRESARQDAIAGWNNRLRLQLREQVSETELAQQATIFAMCKLAESRDPDTGEHLERMQHYSVMVASRLRSIPPYDEIIDDQFLTTIDGASPLHDIGKVALPDDILLKPSSLTAEERATMQTHTTVGADTLRAVLLRHPNNQFVRMGIMIAESHHERWDGRGYPNGLCADQIPLAARIVAVADVYDALTSKRPYKEAFTHAVAMSIISDEVGTHFDPAVAEAFFRAEHDVLHVRQTYRAMTA